MGKNHLSHLPVLLQQVVNALSPVDGAIYVDGTFGGGGYSRAIAEAARCEVIGLDCGPDAIARAGSWLDQWPSIRLLHARFGDMAEALAAAGVSRVDGIVLDLGVSSFQLDEPGRGFSFRHNGPLDMRMSRAGRSAADLVNEESEEELANIIFRYGDERASRRIARAIVKARKVARIEDTLTLADMVAQATRSQRRGRDKIHPATRTFQALRIAVNDEFGELERALDAAETLLGDGGRLVVVTFHSGEDRMVKNFVDERSGRLPGQSRHVPAEGGQQQAVTTFRPVTRRPVVPDANEIEANPRARSAKLRAAIRVRPNGAHESAADRVERWAA